MYCDSILYVVKAMCDAEMHTGTS
eukprot:COSAG01_NODE_54531_length_331_cov_1.112069_1_plen_23_part_10